MQPCREGRSCPDSAGVAGFRRAAVFCRLWCSALLRGRGAGGRQPWYQPPTPCRAGWPGKSRIHLRGRPGVLASAVISARGGEPCGGCSETAARAHEVLALDVDELDLRNRCAKGRRKGSAVDVIVRQTGTAPAAAWAAQGPPDRPGVCNRPARPHRAATRRPRPGHRPRAAVVPPRRRAVRAGHRRCPGGPWTLHQLRHSALTQAARAGANTATLLAQPATPRWRRWPATPASPEALARRQRRDPARRRR
jgi:hypothetical protein